MLRLLFRRPIGGLAKLQGRFIPPKFPRGPLMFDRLLSKPNGEKWVSTFSGLHPCNAGKLLEVDGVARDLHALLITGANHQNTKVPRNGALRPRGPEYHCRRSKPASLDLINAIYVSPAFAIPVADVGGTRISRGW